jgi:hypothetical protein
LLAQSLWNLCQVCSKKRCVIQSSNYPMSIFKELYNKLQ